MRKQKAARVFISAPPIEPSLPDLVGLDAFRSTYLACDGDDAEIFAAVEALVSCVKQDADPIQAEAWASRLSRIPAKTLKGLLAKAIAIVPIAREMFDELSIGGPTTAKLLTLSLIHDLVGFGIRERAAEAR